MPIPRSLPKRHSENSLIMASDTIDQPLSVPSVHLNGTSKERLMSNLQDVTEKLREAYDAMKSAAPNGRDYYVQGPDAIGQAEVQHRGRLERIDSVIRDINAELEAISNQ